MKIYYEWTVKKLMLKNKVVCEFENEAMQTIGEALLDGKFTLELEKKEVEEVVSY